MTKVIHIALAKKKKAKSPRSRFMKALMRQFAKNDPEKISQLFVDKRPKEFMEALQPMLDELLREATHYTDRPKETSFVISVD